MVLSGLVLKVTTFSTCLISSVLLQYLLLPRQAHLKGDEDTIKTNVLKIVKIFCEINIAG